MRRWTNSVAGIGLTAACLMCVGCGGDNAPWAGTSTTAASDSAPEPSTPPPAPAASKPASEPVAAAVQPQPAPAVAANEKDDSGDENQAGASQSTPASKPEDGSSTAEELAIAAANQPASTSSTAAGEGSSAPANPESSGGAAPAGSLSTQGQGQGGMPAGYPGIGNPGSMPASYPGMVNPNGMPAGYPGGGNQGGMPAGYPGTGEQTPGSAASGSPSPGGMPVGYPGTGGQPGGYPGFPGPGGTTTGYPGVAGGGGPTQATAAGGASAAATTGRTVGAADSNFGPADIRSPDGAVRAFLFALSIRDKDRLREATAMRAEIEASNEKSKELFRKIVHPEENISDAELEDIARKLDGYWVAGENAVRSTGKLGIIISRPTMEGGYLTRTVTVRKEKKGWGVTDISNPTEFTATGGNLRRRHTPRRKVSQERRDKVIPSGSMGPANPDRRSS